MPRSIDYWFLARVDPVIREQKNVLSTHHIDRLVVEEIVNLDEYEQLRNA